MVDDQELFADALRMFLERDERVEVVGIASSGQEGIDLALARLADVVLMDVFMRGMDGLLGAVLGTAHGNSLTAGRR